MAAEGLLTDAFLAGDVSRDVYTEKNRVLREERAGIVVELTRLQQTPPADKLDRDQKINRCDSLGDAYRAISTEDRAVLLEAAFAAVFLNHTGIVGYQLRPEFLRLDGLQATRTLAA